MFTRIQVCGVVLKTKRNITMHKSEFDIESTLSKSQEEIYSELESKNIDLRTAASQVTLDEERVALPLLHVAAVIGAENAIRALCVYARRKEYKDWDYVNSTVGAKKHTALHLACKNGREVAVGILLRRGANTALTDAHGYTPLHEAACHGSETMINDLLADGRELLLYAENNEHETPLHHLLDYTENADTAGPIAAAIKFLLTKYIVLPTEEHIALLPLAAKHGRAYAVELLMGKGADVHKPDQLSGKTAFLIAVECDQPAHKQVIETMVRNIPARQKDQMVNATTRSGANALHIVVERNDFVLTGYLRHAGVRTDARTAAKNETPLDLANRKGKDCVPVLTLPLEQVPQLPLTLSRRHSKENARRSLTLDPQYTNGHSAPSSSATPPAQLPPPSVTPSPGSRRSLPGSLAPFSHAALLASKEQAQEVNTTEQQSSCGAFKLLAGLWRSLYGSAPATRDAIEYTPLPQTPQMNGHNGK